MSNRAERRREARVAARGMGAHYAAPKERDLPVKRPGQHRWIATGAWFLTDEAVKNAYDRSQEHLLDQENMFSLSIGCWDCEEPLGLIEYGSPCPATTSAGGEESLP